MTTRRTVLREAEEKLRRAGVQNARLNAEWIICEVLHCSKASLYADLDVPMSGDQLGAFEEMVRRRQEGEPLQYVIGYTEFFDLRISVGPAVLIPRPETEQVVEQALTLLEGTASPRVLDVGTGSGCIALAIKSHRRDAVVWGCDVSASALDVAAANAAANELEVELLELDALSSEFPLEAPQELDLVVSNPPYIARAEASGLQREVRDHEPHLALFAGDDPLVFYRKLVDDAQSLLIAAGWLVLETHAEYGSAAEEIVRVAGYREVSLVRDYAGRPRILIARSPRG